MFRITIATGGLVRMTYLTIQHGDEDGSGKGGGIYFKGDGILELDHSLITNNIASYGGGIYAEGTGTNTELVIGTDVAVSLNTARVDGGGIVNDGTEMTMIQPDSSIAFNHAPDGYGGGLLVTSGNRSAYTYLGTAGFGTSGAIFFNDAKYGGGVAIMGSDDIAQLQSFSTDPARPMRIDGNTASVEGGGVYLGRAADSSVSADLLAWYAYIEDNIAPTGAAIAVRNSNGIGHGVFFNDPAHRPSGAIDCPVGKPCGSIAGNAAIDDASTPVGGIVQAGQFGFTRFHRMTFEGNTGKFVFYGDGGDGNGGQGFETHHVAITGNTTSSNLISTGDSGFVKLYDTTIAGNAIAADTVMRIGNAGAGADQFYRSIIWQPGKTTLHLTAGPPIDVLNDLLDDMVSERDSVDGGNSPNVTVQDPRFVDPEHGDYALRAGSPAIDYTTSVPNDAADLYGKPRDVGLPVVANLGLRDLGAIERQTLQPIVLNSDFDADLRLWNLTAFGVTTWDSTQNKTGAPGSGSAHVSATNLVTGSTVGGLVQCVHLPGPGTYALNGWGRGTGTNVTAGDIAQLYWEYRKSGGENCTDGAPNASGTLALSNGNHWSRPTTPASITVTEQDWTYTSSIAVTLVAREFGPGTASTNAWFDGITLGVDGDDRIFANGFEGP
ncbi:MAG TPA: hypothetical protein VFS55_14295 [Dokdonella sp.]|nr:hypothetical protein [Dokdonella sp.]